MKDRIVVLYRSISNQLDYIEDFLQLDYQSPVLVLESIFEVRFQCINRSTRKGGIQAVRRIELTSIGDIWVAFVLDLDRHRASLLCSLLFSPITFNRNHIADV